MRCLRHSFYVELNFRLRDLDFSVSKLGKLVRNNIRVLIFLNQILKSEEMLLGVADGCLLAFE